jgi:hypothetical protein
MSRLGNGVSKDNIGCYAYLAYRERKIIESMYLIEKDGQRLNILYYFN